MGNQEKIGYCMTIYRTPNNLHCVIRIRQEIHGNYTIAIYFPTFILATYVRESGHCE